MHNYEDGHKFHMHLPRRKSEFAIFLAVISVISVNIIAPLITFMEVGFSVATYQQVLRVLPVLWLTVVALVLLTAKPAQALKAKIVKPTDSFNAHILVETLCSVLLLSVVLTVVGTWIGSHDVNLYPITHFFQMWFRNFGVALMVESLIAQPIARLVMNRLHVRIDARSQQPIPAAELA